ncbi:MAG: hypothetical protein K0S00_4285 [Xanthobacteraceae bacterium]|nr:hypothetical protein [Xanthobacteraceae bacterium]
MGPDRAARRERFMISSGDRLELPSLSARHGACSDVAPAVGMPIRARNSGRGRGERERPRWLERAAEGAGLTRVGHSSGAADRARGDFAARPDLRAAKATPNNATPGWFIVTLGSARQMPLDVPRLADSAAVATVARIHPVAGRPRMLHDRRATTGPAPVASIGTNENAASSSARSGVFNSSHRIEAMLSLAGLAATYSPRS